MDANGRTISQQGWIQGLLIACLIVIAGCAAPAVMADTPLFFPEQNLFKPANDAFLQWTAGDSSKWRVLVDEYLKLQGDDGGVKGGKCALAYGETSNAFGRCWLRATAQLGVAYDIVEGDDEDYRNSAFGNFKSVIEIAEMAKFKPVPSSDYPQENSSDERRKTSNSMARFAWIIERGSLEDKLIITGDPICVAHTRIVPHYMEAKQYKEAARSAQSFLDYCLDTTNWIVAREQKYQHLGLLADAYTGTKEFDKAIAAAKERYYLLPTEEAANSYLKLLNPKTAKKEIANVTEYQSNIRSKIDRWLKLNPRPTEGELSDYLAYDQRKLSLYKNALAATEKLGLKGYDPYLFSEYESLVKSVDSSKGVIKSISESNEFERKRQAESDQSIGEFFNIIEGVQRLRR